MAKVLVLNKNQYLNGVIQLKRLDNWVVQGAVKDRVGGVDTDVDLTGVSQVTGWFPGNVTGQVEVLDASAGKVKISCAPSGNAGAELGEGAPMFITMVDTNNLLSTVVTPDAPLAIADRGFTT